MLNLMYLIPVVFLARDLGRLPTGTGPWWTELVAIMMLCFCSGFSLGMDTLAWIRDKA